MSVLSPRRPRSADPPAAGDDLVVVPARHRWRWAAVALVFVLLAQFVHGLATNPGWDWPTFFGYFLEKSVVEALGVTLILTLAGAVRGFLGGIPLAAMRLSKNPVLSTVSWTYIWVFRSVPLLVQLLFWANLGYLYDRLQVGVPFGPGGSSGPADLVSPFGAALLGLAPHEAAFAGEIIRADLLSVDQGQHEAASALGIPRHRQFFRIVAPQAMRAILPNAANL